MDAGLERLKVISCWEVGRRKRFPVSRCPRDMVEIYIKDAMATRYKNQRP